MCSSDLPLPDVIFPILNTSQNWFAEMLLKVLGREVKGEGSWTAGLDVERRFLTDSVKIDSTAFALEDGSGLAAGNLVTPHAFAQLLAYMHRHPKGAAFVAALPHAGQPGSLLKRFAGTPLEGRVIAKTGSIDRVNSLSGYIEQPNGRTVTFSVQANGHAVPYQQMLAQIDSTAFALEDGSGLAAGNLVTPLAFAQLLAYMHRHPKGAAFVAALPHAGQPGSLVKRFVGTPLEGRVIAKTGSIDRVNSLSGYIEQPNGRTVTFSVQANGHAVPYQQMLAQIDSVVVEIGKTK